MHKKAQKLKFLCERNDKVRQHLNTCVISHSEMHKFSTDYSHRTKNYYRHHKIMESIEMERVCVCVCAGVFRGGAVGWKQSDLLHDVRTELSLQLVMVFISQAVPDRVHIS